MKSKPLTGKDIDKIKKSIREFNKTLKKQHCEMVIALINYAFMSKIMLKLGFDRKTLKEALKTAYEQM